MAYADEILADSPRLWWPWTYLDISGNALHGLGIDVAVGGGQPSLRAGGGSSMGFNGVSSCAITNDHNLLDLGDSFTIEAWVKLDPTGSGTRVIVSKGANAYGLFVDASNNVVLTRTAIANIVTSTVALSTSGIHHVVATKNGATVKLYIDGVDRTGTVTNSTCANNTSAFEVGRTVGPSGYFKGNISDVAVYSGALSAGRVGAHYTAGLTHFLAASFLGAADLTASFVKKTPAAATLAAEATLTATPVRRVFTGATLAAEATMDVGEPVRRRFLEANLAGTGTLDTTLKRITPLAATLAGEAFLTMETAVTFVMAATLAGEAFLTMGRKQIVIPPLPVDTVPVIVTADQASDRFREALRSSHQMVLVLQILDGLTGEVLADLDTVESGTVTLDSSAAIRGRCDLTLVDDGFRDLIPKTARDMLAPYGNEMRIARGIRYPDGTAEAVSLGIFRVRQVGAEDSGDSTTVRVTGLDRMSRLADARFEQTFHVPGGTNAIAIIDYLVTNAYVDCPMDLGSTARTVGQIIEERGNQRDERIRRIALDTLASDIYFNGEGTLVRQPVALATDNNQWTISEGQDGILLRANRDWDAERVYNKVIVSGEPMDETPPVCASAWDDNPNSPTYYYGPFGKRPRFYVSPMITTQQQAADTAASILAGALGTNQSVEFESMVDPTMEPGKVARIIRERLGLDEKHVLDSVTIPLSARESMSAKTRVAEVVGT